MSVAVVVESAGIEERRFVVIFAARNPLEFIHFDVHMLLPQTGGELERLGGLPIALEEA